MSRKQMSSAEVTVRSAMMVALVDTVYETGLRAGPVTDTIIDAMMRNVFKEGPFTWAAKELVEELGGDLAPGVLQEVRQERIRQDAKFGGPEHDDKHPSGDWRDLIVDRANLTIGAAMSRAHELQRMCYLEIAAVAVAAIESLDRRTPPPKRA